MDADGQQVAKGDVVRRGREVGQVVEVLANGTGRKRTLTHWLQTGQLIRLRSCV
jgi:hypothetical protein